MQIFDSWASAIEPTKYDEFGWSYIIEIVDHIKAKYPDTPVILFPKGVSPFIERGLVYGNLMYLGLTGVHLWL